MVRNALKRTLIINAWGFAEMSRYEIAKLIKLSLGSHSIKSIPFMPNYYVHITFESEASKTTLTRNEYLLIGDRHCKVVRVGPRAENILLFHYPYKESDQSLADFFKEFGEVHEVRCQIYPDLNEISTGTRIV